ncbi:MAG: tetratricopeptide repeat protein, partial [Bacteroidales bacterium]|nr:tetratricopeptide repeat protein [Bacteroidales bacterium]
EYKSVEELLLAAQRLEEFHNARVDPLPYYEEALRRDSLDSRVNVNLGIFYARRTQWEKAEKHLQRAYMRLTGLHYMPQVEQTGIIYQTNPKDGEMLYYLGVVSQALGKEKEAESYYWKSAWYPGFQSASYLYLAEIYWKQGKKDKAFEAVNNSIDLSGKSTIGKFVKSYFLSSEGKMAEAKQLLNDNLSFDPLDFLSQVELARLNKDNSAVDHVLAHMGIPLQESIEISTFYGAVGAYSVAVDFLDYVMAHGAPYASTPMQKNAVEPFTSSPLLNYMAGYYSGLAGNNEKALSYYRKAAEMSPEYCFPSRVEEKSMLEDVTMKNPLDYKAQYYLGNLLYYYNQKDEAIAAWNKAAEASPGYGMVYRNLGFATDKYLKDAATAADFYRKAVAVDSSDPKFFTELDILEEALKVPSTQRLARLEKNKKTIFKSDDATSRYVYLLVDNGKYDQALSILNTRHFRVWEGGQTVYTQFVDAHLLNGLKLMATKQYKKALEDFYAAGTFPRNLETNELSTGPTVAKVAYYQGLAYKAIGQNDKAAAAFEKCIETATGGDAWTRRRGGADESRYFVAMAQKALGREADFKATLETMQKDIDAQNATDNTVVDIYSKFGEDGSGATIKARTIYIQGLVYLAKGDKNKAKDSFISSLEINPTSVWTKYFLGTCK